jgi:hypothetical protein
MKQHAAYLLMIAASVPIALSATGWLAFVSLIAAYLAGGCAMSALRDKQDQRQREVDLP